MPRIVRTARGEQIDFDAIVIKQQIAAAPMNIDVARRKEFIDSKEGKVRGARRSSSFVDGAGNATANTFVTGETTRTVVINNAVSIKANSTPTLAGDFEVDAAGTTPIKTGPIEAVPVLPERKK